MLFVSFCGACSVGSASETRWKEVEAVIAGLQKQKSLGQDVHSSAQHLCQHGHLMHRQAGRNTTSGTIGLLKKAAEYDDNEARTTEFLLRKPKAVSGFFALSTGAI
jgi:hypothetical protein